MARILIVGYGDIGIRLGGLLAQKGHEVVGLRRNPPKDGGQIPYFSADVTSVQSLSRLEGDFEHIFFAVAPDHRDEAHYREIYEIGLQHLFARFIKQTPRPHWIFVSSTAVYGVTDGTWIDESSPISPSSMAGALLHEAEKRVWADDAKHIVVRFSGIYGPGRERLLRIARDRTPVQNDPPYYTNRIHQDDCAAVLTFLFEKQRAGVNLASCYLASDDKPAPMMEVVSWLAGHIHGEKAVIETEVKNSNQNKRCRNDRLKALGYVFTYPSYVHGYQPLLESFTKMERSS